MRFLTKFKKGDQVIINVSKGKKFYTESFLKRFRNIVGTILTFNNELGVYRIDFPSDIELESLTVLAYPKYLKLIRRGK